MTGQARVGWRQGRVRSPSTTYTTSLDEAQIKELFKQAVLELFQEQKDLLYDVFAEVIEDFALVNAIKEGESTESVSRAEIFQVLEGAT